MRSSFSQIKIAYRHHQGDDFSGKDFVLGCDFNYGNATKLNFDAEMRLAKIAQLNGQIYLKRRSPVKDIVLKYLGKLNYSRVYYVDNRKDLANTKYGLLLTRKNNPQKPQHRLCRVIEI